MSTVTPPRPVAVLVVAVLVVDAVLLAASELAWLGLRLGPVPLPLAALVAALTTPVVVLAADAAMPRSHAPLVVLGAWLLTVLVAGLWSPSPMGAGVIVPDWRAILLVAAGFLPGLFAARGAQARQRAGSTPPGTTSSGA